MRELIESLQGKFYKLSKVHPSPHDDRTYTPRALLLCSLPYTNPKTNTWIRRAGNYVLTIQADPKFDIPYGPYPRLFNYWLTNEVKRTGRRIVKTGNSYERFLYALGIKDGGRQRKNFIKQAHNLLTANIIFTEHHPKSDIIVDWMKTGVSKRYRLIWDNRRPNEETLFETEIVITEDYFTEIMNHAIPLNIKIVHALKQSPLALDFYGWINYKNFMMISNKIPHFSIAWSVLNTQFGGQFIRCCKFSEVARKHIASIKILWPDLNIRTTGWGLTLRPSPPSVAAKKLYLTP